MTLDQTSNFFVGSILTMLGFIIIAAGIIVINNLIYKYWKPVKMFRYEYKPVYFRQDEPIAELDKTVEPKMEEQINEHIKNSSRTEVQKT